MVMPNLSSGKYWRVDSNDPFGLFRFRENFEDNYFSE